MGFKDTISLPLEAGPSVLDVHLVPPHLLAALEYVAARLARKSLALDLVLVRRDYQLPSILPPFASASPRQEPAPTAASSVLASSSSSSSAFSISSSSPQQPRFAPVTALKQLVRTASRRASDPIRPTRTRQGSQASVASLPFNLDSIRRTPSSAAPSSPSSIFSADLPSPAAPEPPFGVCLVHDPALSTRAHRTLCGILARAEQRFGTGGPWFSQPVSPAACGLPVQLFSSSLVQNEVLFASQGLSLVSLDRFFSLKCALSSYSMTRSPVRLEDATDELHRFVLANNGTRVSKSALLRSYDWLSLSDDTVDHLDRMYRRAYGGPEQVGAIAGMPDPATPPHPEPAPEPETSPSPCQDDLLEAEFAFPHPDDIGIAITTPETSLSPSPRVPTLKLQIDFGPTPPPTDSPRWPWQDDDDDDDDDGDRTALPENFLTIGFDPWAEPSIDHVLSTKPVVLSPDPFAKGPGPLTPKTYGDISPVTRGEWGFLMVDSVLRSGRTVTVETC
ncbi:hypothetical protein HRG_006098 [Hirsutella rhossiliensis]|uniref:DUF7582 domain-containing protein n=1 Tax=Hirsutella rhossiliensis TaxID=111463 RepID=A0A9P8SHX1_9HYPO|nr:uncharacterized protein HRG_06098 [Hirsutella rhossiliensis]KAH0963588.1 hypothetical protein HRG_06098 [Hirsutella rhossiliensis]